MRKKKTKKPLEYKWILDNFGIKVEDNEDSRTKLTERISILKDLIEPYVFGTENYSNWIEIKMLSKSDKNKLLEIFKIFQHLIWESRIVWITNKGYSEWIKTFKAEWNKIGPDLENIFRKISIGWKKYKRKEEDMKRAYGVG